MKIISIDPGYERVGIAIIEKVKSGRELLIHSECFKTSPKIPHADRLSKKKKKIEELIKRFSPDELAIETLFFSGNQKTALLVSESRGVIISVCKSAGLNTFEYGPGEIKLAVTGYGKSSKDAVMRMVPKLIEIDSERKQSIKNDDEYDAIAVGLTHCAIRVFK